MNEVQIFVKGSKRRKFVCSTKPNKCPFLSRFFCGTHPVQDVDSNLVNINE